MAEPSPLGRSCARALSTAGEASSELGGTFHRPIARLSGRPKEVEMPKLWGSPAGVGLEPRTSGGASSLREPRKLSFRGEAGLGGCAEGC